MPRHKFIKFFSVMIGEDAESSKPSLQGIQSHLGKSDFIYFIEDLIGFIKQFMTWAVSV